MNCDHEFYYYAAINEAGWKCSSCGHRPGAPAGYSPQLDREQTFIKVNGLLMDLHGEKFIGISNSDEGIGLAESVAKRCEREGRFDQYSILLYALEAKTPRHAEYWKEIGDGVVSGNDPRDRCHCGELARGWSMRAGKWTGTCRAHDPLFEKEGANG